MSEYDFDLFTIGAGSGGVAASRRAAAHGAKVAICEDHQPGGTCVLRGCVPKKLMVYASSFADDIAVAAGYGWTVEGRVDWPRLVAAKRAEVARLSQIYARMLADAGVTSIAGRGVIEDPHTVRVGEQRYTARRILVATGGRPRAPEIAGAELGMSSDDALERDELPRRIAVVGGGYIAVEFASIFRAAGCAVTMLIRDQGLLRGFDHDVSRHLAHEMAAAGVEIREHASIHAIAKRDDGLHVDIFGGEPLDTDAVLFAIGRVPNSQGLGLAEVGVVLDWGGHVEVDAWSRTAVPSIFAIGDVTARPQLTPMAIADGRAFADTEFGGAPRTVAHQHVATAVFSQPPCGTCGLTEAEARARGEVRVFRAKFRPMRTSFAGRGATTLMKLVVDAETDRVLGVHMVGDDAGEIIQGFAVAVRCGATKAQFDATLAVHPTAAEEFVTMATPVA